MPLSNWLPTPLKQITTKIGSGATPRGGKEGYKSSGISLVRSLNVYDFYFDYDGLAFIDDIQAGGLSNVDVQLDDILLNITGASVARCCIVPDEILPARVNQHVAIVRVIKELANPYFVLYAINSPRYKQHLLTLAQGGATREALTKTTIENFEINMPPLVIQNKIASILTAYDSLIKINSQRIDLLERSAHDLYQEWFVYYRFPGYQANQFIESKLGLIPEGWEIVQLSDAVEINPKTAIAKNSPKPYIPMDRLSETQLLIDTANMEYRTTSSGSKFTNHDTLFARITPCLENGKTGYVQFLPENSVGIGSTEFVVLRSKLLTSEYVYCLARRAEFRMAAQKTMTGASGRQRVQKSFFDQYQIVKPTPEILQSFADVVSPIFALLKTLGEKNARLRECRDILLPRLISGELDVSTLEIQVEELETMEV